MFERTATYTNSATDDQIAWLEPWCEEVGIPSGATLTIRGHGAEDGEIEIEECDGGIIVYGWPTSVLDVECDGQIIWRAYAEVPPIPRGMTIRDFVKLQFYQDERINKPE